MENSQITLLVIAAIVIVIGLALMPAISNNINTVTNTVTYTNQQQTAAAVNSTITLNGQNFEGTPSVTNATNATKDITAFFTIKQVKNGATAIVTMKTLDTGVTYAGIPVNVTYISEPTGYGDAPTRSIADIILIFVAIAIAAVGLYPVVKEYI